MSGFLRFASAGGFSKVVGGECDLWLAFAGVVRPHPVAGNARFNVAALDAPQFSRFTEIGDPARRTFEDYLDCRCCFRFSQLATSVAALALGKEKGKAATLSGDRPRPPLRLCRCSSLC